jgi:ATP-binding cassette, subfamily B, bacterial PglK
VVGQLTTIGRVVRLWHCFSVRRKKQLSLLVVLYLVGAGAEIVSLGSVVPFLMVIASPGEVLNTYLIGAFLTSLDIVSRSDILVFVTSVFCGAVVVSGAVRLLINWITLRLVFAVGADLSVKIYDNTLHQSYSTHIAENSSQVVSGIVHKVSALVSCTVLPVVTLINSTIIVVCISGTLFYIHPLVTSMAMLFFLVLYVGVTRLFRDRLKRNSILIANEQVKMIKALQEGLGGIRDVILDANQPYYSDIYQKADRAYRYASGSNIFIAQSPRYIIEALGMLMIALFALLLSQNEGGFAAVAPILGALALGAQRLLPLMQLVYSSRALLLGNEASMIEALVLLERPVYIDDVDKNTRISFSDKIEVEGMSFSYDTSKSPILNKVDLTIYKGSITGFVGATGSGKSSLLDVVMGLLVPSSGSVKIDGEQLVHSNTRPWQNIISHVPQAIFLTDATVMENIAFGLSREKIDMQRVVQAAENAQIAGFIRQHPDGYDMLVGERGVQLSGGQRQRIGIARALYKYAEVLILDEATSALDNATEKRVMDGIYKLRNNMTVFLIAHRISTIKQCDNIIFLDKGLVVAEGTYEELLQNNTEFCKIAGVHTQ